MTVARVYQAPVEVLQTTDPDVRVYQEAVEVLQVIIPITTVARVHQVALESLRPSFGPFVGTERPTQTFTCG
jgi:hypothetical protein